jgi:hypothetical protein
MEKADFFTIKAVAECKSDTQIEIEYELQISDVLHYFSDGLNDKSKKWLADQISKGLKNASLAIQELIKEQAMKHKAILSASVMPIDGTYTITTLDQAPDITGLPHYVGHPSTRGIIESLGAVKAESNLFAGLEVGESVLICSLKQARCGGQSDRNVETEVTADDLQWRLLVRGDL